MLRIAIPNKGSLSEGALTILTEAGYKAKRHSRELYVYDEVNDIEFIYLRPRDIAIYVNNGIIDLGITGRDLAIDSQSTYAELLPLNFGKSRFCFAVPKEMDWQPKDFGGKRIACSYRNVVQDYFKAQGIDASVVKLDGAVEISIRLGVADAIADVVESGRTLKEAGLKVVGEPIMHSEAILMARSEDLLKEKSVEILVDRFKGVLLAREYCLVEYDIPTEKLAEACKVTPGVESPTVSPLHDEGWSAVKAMAKTKRVNEIMDELKALGAKGIFVADIKVCRL